MFYNMCTLVKIKCGHSGLNCMNIREGSRMQRSEPAGMLCYTYSFPYCLCDGQLNRFEALFGQWCVLLADFIGFALSHQVSNLLTYLLTYILTYSMGQSPS
jgi:hypothetical protein